MIDQNPIQAYLTGIQRFRTLCVSVSYNIMMVGGLNLTPNLRAFE